MPADGSGYADNFQAASTTPGQDVYTSLERIAKLHQQGALTDEEYSKMKAELLEKV